MQTGLGNKNIPTGETRAFKHSVNSVKRDTLLNKRDFFLRLLTHNDLWTPIPGQTPAFEPQRR